MPSKDKPCQHKVLQLEPSPFAPLAGYSQPSHAALASQIKGPKETVTRTFPAPLVLPHDELNYDPDEPPQSIDEWVKGETRNQMSKQEKTLYVARVPEIGPEVDFMNEWRLPRINATQGEQVINDLQSPETFLFVDYLKAFYAGMTVKEAPMNLAWTTWDKKSRLSRKVNVPKYIGLSHNSSKTRVRVRRTPDGVFDAQLNLDDILDTLIETLPSDAYAIVLLVDHDIYESEEDDFCCGRAYGGSRVAVVQTARYNPILDVHAGLDRSHMWPLSHCKDFVDTLCAVEDVEPRRPSSAQTKRSAEGPMRRAVDAAASFVTEGQQAHSVRALWFSRLARTVSHELGHCLGMAHCSYHACNMQGTANMKEDVRQPPYLCPVCEAKVGHAVVRELRGSKEEALSVWMCWLGASGYGCTNVERSQWLARGKDEKTVDAIP
jgi:archaemetzincin